MGWIAGGCCSGVVVAFCLAVGELALRAAGFGSPLQYDYDPTLLWKMTPDQIARSPSYGLTYCINSQGWRDDELPRARPSGELRILGVGDSVLFGQGVATAPKALQYADTGVSDRAWAYGVEQLSWIANACEARGIPLIVVVFPFRSETLSGLQEEHPSDLFHLIDLHEADAQHAASDLFLDLVHPTSLGNEVAASVVLAHLRASGLLARRTR